MHLYIRTDADSKMGTGHIMRCIALAQAWHDQGGEVTFISHCESEPLKQRINDEGIGLIPIERICPEPSDLKTTLSILKNDITDQQTWLALDGYHFTPEYQKAIREAGISLLVIDDMNHLPYYHADILHNQNIYAPDLTYHCDEDTTLLLGIQYVLLRREFLKYYGFKRNVPDRVKNILVTLGGADQDNTTLKVIEALKFLDDQEIEVKIVIGPANHHITILSQALSSTHFKAALLFNPPNMPDLMAWADLAISAGGSTCWELLFMGLPSLIVVLAENQLELAKNLEEQDVAFNLGWHEGLSTSKVLSIFESLYCNKMLRKNISEKASALIDGQGTSHVKRAMSDKLISLRQVTDSDCDLVWQWSNEKETRNASFSEKPISWEEHVHWFKEKLADPNHVFFIVTNGNKNPLGQIRYSVEGKKAVVSFSIAPESRNLGYGSEILKIAAQKLFYETEVEEILAFVKAENLVSSKTFQNAGFKQTEELFLHGTKSYKFVLIKTGLT